MGDSIILFTVAGKCEAAILVRRCVVEHGAARTRFTYTFALLFSIERRICSSFSMNILIFNKQNVSCWKFMNILISDKIILISISNFLRLISFRLFTFEKTNRKDILLSLSKLYFSNWIKLNKIVVEFHFVCNLIRVSDSQIMQEEGEIIYNWRRNCFLLFILDERNQ